MYWCTDLQPIPQCRRQISDACSIWRNNGWDCAPWRSATLVHRRSRGSQMAGPLPPAFCRESPQRCPGLCLVPLPGPTQAPVSYCQRFRPAQGWRLLLSAEGSSDYTWEHRVQSQDKAVLILIFWCWYNLYNKQGVGFIESCFPTSLSSHMENGQDPLQWSLYMGHRIILWMDCLWIQWLYH